MTIHDDSGQTVAWQSPSNIAIIKYWGKTGVQKPMNPSVSFTLDKCFTTTQVSYELRGHANQPPYDLIFDGNPNPLFNNKLNTFFQYVFERYPVLRQYVFHINTTNTFPHSAGLASSASGMSALALCLIDINNRLQDVSKEMNFDESGSLARLGSGSACRSVRGGWMIWGYYKYVPFSNDDYAISIQDNVHPLFHHLHDTILVISSQCKSMSSSEGHALMNTHPYVNARKDQVLENTEKLLDALKQGDFETFTIVCEEEALSLHALMMSSRPGFSLMHPNTLLAIERIRAFRQKQVVPICFSLDIGPNVHLIYPDSSLLQIDDFITRELMPLCENHQTINDCIGKGPIQLSHFANFHQH